MIGHSSWCMAIADLSLAMLAYNKEKLLENSRQQEALQQQRNRRNHAA